MNIQRVAIAVFGWLLCVGSMLASSQPALAHNLNYAVVKVTLDEGGRLEASVNFHVAAFLMGQPQGHLAADQRELWASMSDVQLSDLIANGEAYFREGFEVYADDRRLRIEAVEFPDPAILREDGLVSAEDARPSAPVKVRVQLPRGARSLQVAAPLVFSEALLSIEQPDGVAVAQVLREGQKSHPFALDDKGATIVTVAIPDWLVTAWQYAVLGFEHIAPKGTDHILFVVGLFLLAPRWRPLAWQVTAFTLAHSLTLALAVFDVVAVPAIIVEPLIALTIVAVAIDNLVSRTLKPWRTGAVFAFGLLHGLGFAGVLRALGLPRGEEAVALLSFNVGVEFGQLAVLAAAFLAVGWFRDRNWYRSGITIPMSFAIGAAGLFWMAERILANL